MEERKIKEVNTSSSGILEFLMNNLSKTTRAIASIISLIVIFSANFNPTDYVINYIICQHIIFFISVYSIWTAVKARNTFWICCFFIIAFLFNPVFLIPPPNTLIGFVIVLSAAALFAISIPLVKSPKKDKEKIGFTKKLGMIMISISTLLILIGIHDAIVDRYGEPTIPHRQQQPPSGPLMDVTEQYYQSTTGKSVPQAPAHLPPQPIEPAGKFHYLIPKKENRIYRGDPTRLIILGIVFMICGIILFEKKKTPSKICPYCAEKIKVEAIVCRYCGRDLPREDIKIS